MRNIPLLGLFIVLMFGGAVPWLFRTDGVALLVTVLGVVGLATLALSCFLHGLFQSGRRTITVALAVTVAVTAVLAVPVAEARANRKASGVVHEIMAAIGEMRKQAVASKTYEGIYVSRISASGIDVHGKAALPAEFMAVQAANVPADLCVKAKRKLKDEAAKVGGVSAVTASCDGSEESGERLNVITW